jgi:hypothetical protein
MSLLRRHYLNGFARWTPEEEPIDLPGEAEAMDFAMGWDEGAALEAARCLELQWTEEARDWVRDVMEDELAVPIEQCMHDGTLLGCELRALRLKRFSPAVAVRTEHAIDRLPSHGAEAALAFIYWLVRIERARRTGDPQLDPSRPPFRWE